MERKHTLWQHVATHEHTLAPNWLLYQQGQEATPTAAFGLQPGECDAYDTIHSYIFNTLTLDTGNINWLWLSLSLTCKGPDRVTEIRGGVGGKGLGGKMPDNKIMANEEGRSQPGT